MECKNGFTQDMITLMEFLLFLLTADDIIEYILICRGVQKWIYLRHDYCRMNFCFS